MSLPITLALGPQESLRSYLRRTLVTNGIGAADRRRWFPQVNWATACMVPTKTELDMLSIATGQPPPTLLEASLLGYRTAIPLLVGVHASTPRAARYLVRRTWLWMGRTQCCLQCLSRRPDLWLRDWQSPYVFGCLTHRCLLLTRCPNCATILSDGHSHGPGPTNRDTDNHHLAPADLQVLRRILAALSGASTSCGIGPVAPNDYVDALRSLSGLLCHLDRYAHPNGPFPSRPVIAAPEAASRRRDLLTRADHLLGLTPEQAALQLGDGLAQVPREGGRGGWLRSHSLPTTITEPIYQRTLTNVVSAGWARIDPVPQFDPATVPQLVWPDVWAALRSTTSSGPCSGRAFMSLLLVKMNLEVTRAEAGEHLGWPAILTRRVSVTGQKHLVHTEALANALQSASQAHLRNPNAVDYRARERLITALANSPDQLLEWQMRQRISVETTFVVAHAWNTWAFGHPSLAPQNHHTDRTWRATLNSLTCGWKPRLTAELRDWLEHQVDPANCTPTPTTRSNTWT